MKGPKTGVVGAKVSCSDFEKNQFHHSHCCLAISVGQPYHEGERLRAAIDYINENFAQCTIALGDTLQRHNIEPSLAETETYQLALKAGDDWLERNTHYIQALTIPYKIDRWDTWLNTADYRASHALVYAAYENDSNFRAGFHKTIDQFVNRLRNRNDLNEQKLREVAQNSLAFLLEESTIIMLLWQREGYNYIAYPGAMIDALAVTYKKFVAPYQDHLVKWLPLDFRRYARQTTMPSAHRREWERGHMDNVGQQT